MNVVNWREGCEPVEIYFNNGETLPLCYSVGSTALNVDTFESYIFTGKEWRKAGA
jgi:hypothetical protein